MPNHYGNGNNSSLLLSQVDTDHNRLTPLGGAPHNFNLTPGDDFKSGAESVSAVLTNHFSLSGFSEGDSGGATFILYDSELLLCGKIYASNGQLTPLSIPGSKEIIQKCINHMGNTENYQVSSVDLY